MKLNDEKLRLSFLGYYDITKHLPSASLHIDDISLEETHKDKDLVVTIDNNFSMSFLSAISVKVPMYYLEKFPAKEIIILTTEITKTVISSFALLRLYSCNDMLAGISKESQEDRYVQQRILSC